MIMKQTASAAATPPFNASSLIRDTRGFVLRKTLFRLKRCGRLPGDRQSSPRLEKILKMANKSLFDSVYLSS